MNETYLFIWGVIAFLFAVGPLIVAGFLDLRERQHAKEIEDAANLNRDSNS